MSLSKLIGYLSIIVILLIVLAYVIFQPATRSEVQSQINNANFCGSSDDCGLIESKCPFDCTMFVNINEVDKMNELIGDYKSKCINENVCQEAHKPSCVQNKCQ